MFGAGRALICACIAATPTSTPTSTSAPATTQARIDNPEPHRPTRLADNPSPSSPARRQSGPSTSPKGFHAELVAEEPMVQHPVAMAFDPDGRLWVCEMRGYMPDPEGNGEKKPRPGGSRSSKTPTATGGWTNRPSSSTSWSCRARSRLARDGLLVAAPPKLLFCRDTDGDGKADEQTVIATDFGGLLEQSGEPGQRPAATAWTTGSTAQSTTSALH